MDGKNLDELRESIVLDNIMARTIVRSYSDKDVDDEQIEKVLRTVMAAPTSWK